MTRLKKAAACAALAVVMCALSGCFIIAPMMGMKGGYSFTGASIPPAATTFSVAYMPNNTSEFTTLSAALTEGLRDRFVRQTRLSQVQEGGDLAFEGEIVSALEAPAAIGASGDNQTEGAVRNRMTITVTVLFTNEIDPKLSFESRRSFTAYTDYDVDFRMNGGDNALVEDLVEKLVDEIFNAAVAQW